MSLCTVLLYTHYYPPKMNMTLYDKDNWNRLQAIFVSSFILLCLDFNECAANDTNECEQNCENNLGSYTCSCSTGYIVALDQRSCDGK